MSQLLRRLVVLQPGEAPALLASFAMLLCMFTSYAILRPVRDAMGITSGLEKLPYLFWATFVVMLALQPVYGWLTSRLPRSVFLPWVYGFFTANLLGFYLWFQFQAEHIWIARTYFVWVSVFNLFVVAVFWSLMADAWTREQAGRLFGAIAAGASTGGIIGPSVAQYLAVPLGTINLLLISAGLLALSMVFMFKVLRWQRQQGATGAYQVRPDADRSLGGGMFAGFTQLIRSPYLMGIALFVLMVTWANTFLYLEQQAYIAKVFATTDLRTSFNGRVDKWVQLAALIMQLFVFGRLYKRVGLTVMLVSVPVIMIAGYSLFALLPLFPVLVGVFAVRRVGEYAISRPCRDSLYTLVSREERYKAKSLIDTFVYRGGDATSASLFKLLTSGLGAGPAGVGWFGAGISVLWTLLALSLGRAEERRRTAAVPATP
jgi:AAA family ATP:ADP antiporter